MKISRHNSVRKRFFLALIHIIHFVRHNPWKIIFASTVAFWVCAFFTFKLFQDIRTDFATMLPDSDRSVVHAREATRRVGGVGNIFVSVSSPDFNANKKFVTDFATMLKTYPPDLIKFFDYNTQASQDFFKKRLFYYLTIEELRELRAALAKRLEKTRLSALGLDLDESDPDKTLRRVLKKIYEKYKSQSPFGTNLEGFFTDTTGENVMIIIRPAREAADQQFSKIIVDRLNQDIQKLNPAAYHYKMEVGLAGTYASLLENFSSIIRDTVETAAITIFLVLVSIYLFYRSLRMVLILCMSILLGILITFAVTYFHIGYLNQQTAFLASIIVGNGINFGLILMARYFDERGYGNNVERAVSRALVFTMSATFMAALSTSVSYGILSVTTFKGFSQFGFIGGIGMLICWLSLTVMIPCFILVFERFRPQKMNKLLRYATGTSSTRFADLIWGNRKALLIILYVLTPIMIAGTVLYVREDRFEYNLKNLSMKVNEGKGAEAYYMKRVDAILGNGTHSSLLIALDRREADIGARKINDAVKKAKEAKRPLLLHSARWLDQYFPTDQNEKYPIIRDIRRLFKPKYLSLLSREQQPWGKIALGALDSKPFALTELPEMVLRFFREKDGTLGRLFFVAATDEAVLSNIQDLVRIGKEISTNLKIAKGEEAQTGEYLFASESMIFTDILANVSTEGPLVTVICFIAVGVLILGGFRRIKEFLLVYVFLTLGMLAFIATLYFFQIKLNFFNFITIPITIGIGVDYAINIFYRYKVENKTNIKSAIASTGAVVFLCSWTTIIGYGSMLSAKNQAMVSFGAMAVIGEICCLLFAMVFMTAYLGVREDKRIFAETSTSRIQVDPVVPEKRSSKKSAPAISKSNAKNKSRSSNKKNVSKSGY